MNNFTGKPLITENFKKLEVAFKRLKFKLCLYLEDQNVTYEKFLRCANNFFPEPVQYGVKNIEGYITKAEALGELELIRPDSLQNTMKLIAEEKEDVEILFDEYQNEKHNYYTATKIVDFLVSKDKEHLLYPGELRGEFNVGNKEAHHQLGIKIKETIEEKTLDYVERLWKSMSPMFFTPAKAVLQYIYEACIEVTWSVSSHDMKQFSTKNLKRRRRNLQKAKIITVWHNGEVLYHEDIHIGKNKMKVI